MSKDGSIWLSTTKPCDLRPRYTWFKFRVSFRSWWDLSFGVTGVAAALHVQPDQNPEDQHPGNHQHARCVHLSASVTTSLNFASCHFHAEISVRSFCTPWFVGDQPTPETCWVRAWGRLPEFRLPSLAAITHVQGAPIWLAKFSASKVGIYL